MKTQKVTIISIRPEPDEPAVVDVKDILTALKLYWDRWQWCVRNLDWLGNDNNAEAFCRDVEAAGPTGLWIAGPDLLRHACDAYQTVEGEFLAFPREIDPKEVDCDQLSLRAFPTSRAELAIVVVDGFFFEIYAKDPEALVPIRRLKNVRDENPAAYF
jgi:hypothetical protein